MAWAYSEILINRAENTKEKDVEDKGQVL